MTMRRRDFKQIDEQWLSCVPSEWNAVKIKYLFRERIEKSYPNEQLLVASQNMGVVPKDVYGLRTVEATKDLHLLKLVRVGDFVISLRSFQGGIEYAYYQGIISPAYTVMIPNKMISSSYFRYLAKSRLFIELLRLSVTGIREGQNIDYEKLRNHLIPVPPRPEQDQIVRYLDWQVARIDRLIEGKKRELSDIWDLIQLFLFSEHGDRSSIGSFQTAFDQFSTIKAKRLFVERSSKGHTDKELLAVTQDRGVLYKKDCPQNYVKPNDISKQKLVVNGDYIISLRSFQGGIEFSELEGLVSTSYSVFYIRDEFKFFQEYYALLFKSAPFVSYLNSLVNDIRDGKKIDFNTFSQCELPKPPASLVNKIHELKQAYNDKKNALNRFKELTEELKQSLISDVVTGRKDVRSIDVPN